MLTIEEQWLSAIPIALVAFHACKFRWWLGLLPLIWTANLVWSGTLLFLYDFSGESEIYENATVFFSSLAGSVVLILFATCYGIYMGRR